MLQNMSEPKTIFLVDDDEFVRDSLRALLETRQFKVEDFPSGRQFLKEHGPDADGCLILDIHMPEMSGIDVLKELRVRRDMTPVILMTGRRDRDIETQAEALGAVALLDKPIPYGKFFAMIEQALAD